MALARRSHRDPFRSRRRCLPLLGSRSSIRGSAASSANPACFGRHRHDATALDIDCDPGRDGRVRHLLSSRVHRTTRLAAVAARRAEAACVAQSGSMRCCSSCSVRSKSTVSWRCWSSPFWSPRSIITLMDFIEEDLSRKLPPSERINHTLLAINYGAILVLLLPVLIGWAMQPTAIVPAYHAALSLIAVAAAIGAGLCGLRDFTAARRLARMTSAPAGELVAILPPSQTVLVTGATGFIGTPAGREPDRGRPSRHRPGARSRASAGALPLPITLITQSRSARRRHSHRCDRQSRRRADRQRAAGPRPSGRRFCSRACTMTGDIVRLIGRLDRKPRVLVNGSAIGWYGLWQDQPLTESAKSHACFSHDLCEAWEQAARDAEAHGVRVCAVAHRACGRARRRLSVAAADAVRVRPRRSARLGPAMDVVDRARRSRSPDRACDRQGGSRAVRSMPLRRFRSATSPSPKSLRAACTVRRPFVFPPACCGGSAAISPTSCCSAASAWCRTRRSPTASCFATRACAVRCRRFCERYPSAPLNTVTDGSSPKVAR